MPEEATITDAAAFGIATCLRRGGFPGALSVDTRTAVFLFFHEHDWEQPILGDALETETFYIGAQGSRRTQERRLQALA